MTNMPNEQRKSMMKKRTALITMLCVLLLVIVLCVIVAFTRLNSASFLSSDTCYAQIDVAGYGTITVALDCEAAPETTANFIQLADSGFYNGLTFHRVVCLLYTSRCV